MKNVGPVLIRLAVGIVFALHGLQKLFGLIEPGGGLEATTREVQNAGLEPARLLAIAAGVAQLLGGVLLTLGFLTRLAAATLASTLFVAIFRVHWGHGFFNDNKAVPGFEYPLLLVLINLAFVLSGPGPLALDNLISLKRAPPPKK